MSSVKSNVRDQLPRWIPSTAGTPRRTDYEGIRSPLIGHAPSRKAYEDAIRNATDSPEMAEENGGQIYLPKTSDDMRPGAGRARELARIMVTIGRNGAVIC